MLLILMGQGSLLAQEAPQPAWPQSDPNNAQYDSQATQPYAPDQQPAYAPAQALTTVQLEQLVAPIALYPDTLVAQVLAAATYPAQVVDADHWRQAQGYASPDQIAAGADAQSWDPSLKALTAFPQILAEMDQNLRWTIALGNAYYNQPQDVLDVVQVMRQRAQAAGNLESTPQEAVSYDQGYIQLAPANPQLVYVPAFNPWTAYGEPIQPYRGFSLGSALGSFFNSSFGSGALRYGLGIAMSAFSHTSFGWLGWGLNWLTHSVLFHNSNYYSHSTTVADWGLPRGGPRAPYAHGAVAARLPNTSYRPQAPANYSRPMAEPNGYNGYNRSAGQGYLPPAARPLDRYADNRLVPSPYRGYSAPATGYARQPLEAYNRIPQQVSRPQEYSRPGNGPGYGSVSGYGSGSLSARGGGYAPRPSPVYAAPPAYRSPAPVFQQRGDSRERSTESFAGRGFDNYSGKQAKSGGFHLFGGGREPKSFSSEKKFSSHHSDGGGHSGGHSSGHGGGHHR